MGPYHSASVCIPWLLILIIECLAIVILNIITIIVFVKKKRQLQRRSTYLIIHLAIVDLLAGAVSGPLMIESQIGAFCGFWYYSTELAWSYHAKYALRHLFPLTSLANLAAISLERLHATVSPIRHRCLRKWVYRMIIIVIWLTTTLREAAQFFLRGIIKAQKIDYYLYIPFYAISLFFICGSYILIAIRIRYSRLPQFHPVSKRERKLTGTSLIVSFVSLLCFSPAIIVLATSYFFTTIFTIFHVHMAVVVLFIANSLVNPVIYASRMPGFSEGLSQLVSRAQTVSTASIDLQLRNLRRA